MRLRSFLSRCVCAVFACWFAVVMAQPIGVRACPTEGGVLEEVAPGAMPSAMDHQHMMAMDMTPHEQAPVHNHEKTQCNCISDCCGSLPAALPTLGNFVPVPERQLARAPKFPAVEQSFEEPDYLQPPSTAPPTPASAVFGA